MDKIEAFENELRSLDCIFVEPEEYPTDDAIKLIKDDTDSFIEIIKTFTGHPVIFTVVAETMFYAVVFHGRIVELAVSFEDEEQSNGNSSIMEENKQ